MRPRLLVIDDDEALAAMVVEYLGDAGFDPVARHDAASGLAELEAKSRLGEPYELLILDVMLPDRDGFAVCRSVRAAPDPGVAGVPILMLTARGDETDRIVGLELGADDYLPKPFNPRELLARARAILRRGARTPEQLRDLLHFGRLEIDRGTRVVRIDGEERPLTGYQFDLLCVLAQNPGRVMSRDVLMQHLQGHELESFDRSIDVHVSRVRAAIEDDPKRPRRILTVRGVGYVFASRQDHGRDHERDRGPEPGPR